MSATLREKLMALALVCDDAGTVINLLYDGLGISAAAIPARTLLDLVDRESAEKARAFLETVREQQTAFGWELNVLIDSHIQLLHFAGCIVDDGLLITAAKTPLGLARICAQIASDGQVQAWQHLPDSKRHMQHLADGDSLRYQELTLLNNELVTLQRELVKRTIELETSNDQKNEFIGMAAHDLRNPLQVIDGYSQLLLRETFGPLTTEQREMVSAIRRNSDFMLRLITDVLHISRIETGKLQLELRSSDLVDLIRKNVQLNRLLAQQKEIDLSFSSRDEQLTIEIDPQKIEQVLNNLLQNAIKFSNPGTVVTVGLNRTERGAVIAVKDQGQGIPAQEMDRLFKPFQTTSVRSTGGEPSTGLGLAIAKRIAVAHQGDIWAESQPGAGSTFYLQLPLSPLSIHSNLTYQA